MTIVVRKIGIMLQEIGVLKPRHLFHGSSIERSLGHFTGDFRRTIIEYLAYQKKYLRSDSTILIILRDIKMLHQWSAEHGLSTHLFYSESHALQAHFAYLHENYAKSRASNFYYRMDHFYRWALDLNYIQTNPMPRLNLPQREIKPTVCSERQIAELLRFIKMKSADPQLAMMISLSLLFGFTIEQFQEAKVIWTKGGMQIFFEKTERTFKSRARRASELLLPKNPPWFADLQRRYHKDWLVRTSKVDVDPLYIPLLIHD